MSFPDAILPKQGHSRARRAIVILLVAGAVTTGVFAAGVDDWQRLLANARGMGLAGAVLVASLYLPTGFVGGAGTPVTLVCGYLFGFGYAALTIVPMANASAQLSFLLGRYLASGRIQRFIANRPRLNALRDATGSRPIRLIVLLRLSPVIPFSAVNYFASLTSISFRHYALGTFVGTLPVIAINAYLGSTVQTVGGALTGRVGNGALTLAISCAGIAAMLALAILLMRGSGRALRQLAAQQEAPA